MFKGGLGGGSWQQKKQQLCLVENLKIMVYGICDGEECKDGGESFGPGPVGGEHNQREGRGDGERDGGGCGD